MDPTMAPTLAPFDIFREVEADAPGVEVSVGVITGAFSDALYVM
jgi:hypothetical protein